MSRKNKVHLAGWAILSSAMVIATVLIIIAATMSLAEPFPGANAHHSSSLSTIAAR